MKYVVIDYYDVWYNDEEGYSVNDIAKTDIEIEITDNDTDIDILHKLVNADYFDVSTLYDTDIQVIWYDDYFIEIFHVDDNGELYPLCRLEKI